MYGDSTYKLPKQGSWKATASHIQLEVGNKRSVGLVCSRRVSHRFNIRTPPNKIAYSSHIQSRSVRTDPTGSKGTSKQGCGFRSSESPGPDGFLLEPIPSPQKRRGPATSDKLESPKRIRSNATLQDGRNPYFEGISETRRLARKTRSKRRILYNSYTSESQEVSQVSLPRENLRNQLSPLWPLVSSMGLYQDPKTSISSSTTTRGAYDCLHRRHTVTSRLQRVVGRSGLRTGLSPGVFGIPDQHEEIPLTAKSVNRIPWDYGRYLNNGAKTTGRKVEKDSCRSRSVFEGGVNHSEGSFPAARQNECSHTGDTSSSSFLSPFTNELVSGTRLLLPELRDKYNVVLGLQRGTELVDCQHEKMEWQNTTTEGNRFDNRIRCISHRMGSGMLLSEDRRSVVSDGKDDAYKLFGVAGSNSSSSDICKEQQQNIFATASRQHYSSGIHQQPGWDDFQAVSWSSKGPMDVVSGEKHPHHSTTSTWEVELPCRHRKSSDDGSLGLETESNYISEDRSTVWSTRSGSVCLQTNNPTTDIFQLEARPICNGVRFFPPRLDYKKRICESTLVHDRSNIVTGQIPTGSNCVGDTSLEVPTMVPGTFEHGNRLSEIDTRQPSSSQSTISRDVPSTSRMAYLRER